MNMMNMMHYKQPLILEYSRLFQPYRSSLYDFHSDFHADIISKDEWVVWRCSNLWSTVDLFLEFENMGNTLCKYRLYIIYMTIETNANLLHQVHFTDPTTFIKYPWVSDLFHPYFTDQSKTDPINHKMTWIARWIAFFAVVSKCTSIVASATRLQTIPSRSTCELM